MILPGRAGAQRQGSKDASLASSLPTTDNSQRASDILTPQPQADSASSPAEV